MLRDRVLDVDLAGGLGAAVARLEDVTGIAEGQADVPAGQRVDVLRRMELADVGSYRLHHVGRLGEILRLLRIGIEAEIPQRGRQHVAGTVEQHDAAILELRDDGRIEDHAQRIDRRVGQALPDLGNVVADARGAPHPRHGMGVAWIVLGQRRHDLGIEVLPVLQLRLVEGQEDVGLELAHEEGRGRRHDDIVARPAGAQLGVEDLVGIVGRVVDLDAGVPGEVLDLVFGDVVRPVVDVDGALGGKGPGGGKKEQRGNGKQTHRQLRRIRRQDTCAAGPCPRPGPGTSRPTRRGPSRRCGGGRRAG